MKIRERLLKRFRRFKYRHAYVDDFTDAYIATQIKVLRDQRKLSQTQLADLAGMQQSQISELEDVNNQSWKVRTLKKLAKAFDLVLVVRFEEFGKVLPDIGNLDVGHLQRTSFKDDPVFARDSGPAIQASAAASGWRPADRPIDAGDATASNAKVGRVLSAAARFNRDVPNVA